MHNIVLALLLAVQPNTTTARPADSMGQTAAECAVFFKIRQANATTDEQKTEAGVRQRFMVVLMKKNGLTVEDFVRIGDPYKREFDRRVAARDDEFIRSQAARCDAFAVSEDRKLAPKAR